MLSNMQKHQYILESELCGINIENREDAIRYIQKCIEDCKDEQVKAQMLFCYKDFAITMAHMKTLSPLHLYAPTQGFQGINTSNLNIKPQYN